MFLCEFAVFICIALHSEYTFTVLVGIQIKFTPATKHVGWLEYLWYIYFFSSQKNYNIFQHVWQVKICSFDVKANLDTVLKAEAV